MRRIWLLALSLVFSFGLLGCQNTEPENPELKENRLNKLNEKNKEKGKNKGPLTDN